METLLDRRNCAALLVDGGNVLPGKLLDFVCQRLHEVRAGHGVWRVDHTGFVANDLLGPERHPCGVFSWQAQRLVEAVGMERLRTAHHCGHRLQRDAHDVVHRLLCGERRAAGLGVEPQHLRLRVLSVEPFGHDRVPHAAARTELGDLFEEVVVPVPEEAEPWCKVVDVKARVDCCLHVGNRVGEREGDLLHGRRTGLANVVAGDRDRVPARHALGAVLEDVGDDPH